MKTILSLLLIVICLSSNATTYVGDLYFNGQEEMDNFFLDNPDVTIIDGIVDLSGGMTNFDAFYNITEIPGILYLINSYSVESILGFSNLTYLGGLQILGDFGPNISSLYGFHNLQYLGAFGLQSTYYITDISAINNLDGITNLSFIDCHNLVYDDVFPNVMELDYFYFFELYEHYSKFSGLNNVTHATSIHFAGSDMLQSDPLNLDSLDAFHNLISVNEVIMVMESPKYFNCFQNLVSIENLTLNYYNATDVPDFPSLTSATTITLMNGEPDIAAPSFNALINLYELNCDYSYYSSISLESLEIVEGPITIQSQGVGYSSIIAPNITYIGGNINILANLIDNITFLENVTFAGGTIDIAGNANLSDCDIYLFCEESGFYLPNLSVSGNAQGCNSISEIEVSCISSSVTGAVYSDINCNGYLDANEFALPGFPVFDQNQVPIGTAFSNGNFWAPLPDNSTTTLSMGQVQGFEPSPTIELITGNEPIEFTDMNIGLCPLPDYHNLGT